MKTIGVISDTHGTLDEPFIRFLEPCDEIWHAGDIGSGQVADVLEKTGRLRAVYGNIDDQQIRSRFPAIQLFICEETKVMIVHIGGYPPRYNGQILPLLSTEKPGILVTGHSHILKIQYDRKHRLMYINPGAAGRSGFHRKRTAVRFGLNHEGLHNMEVLETERSES